MGVYRSGWINPNNSGAKPAQLVGASQPVNTIVLLGDSITNRNREMTGSVGQTTATAKRGPFTMLNILLGQRFNVINYAGVDAEDASEILARLGTDVLAYRPKYVFILAGTNDIVKDTNTAEAVWADIKSMIDQSISAGIIPIVGTIMNRANVTISALSGGASSGALTQLTQPRLQKLLDINELIREYAFNNSGMILVDWASVFALSDTLANAITGLPKDLYTADGVHPLCIGATALANYGFSVLDSIIPKNTGRMTVPSAAAMASGETNSAIENGSMIGTGGSIVAGDGSGDVADQWRLAQNSGGTLTGVCSKVARTDGGSGEWQRVVVSGATSVAKILRLDQSTAHTLAETGFAVGDTIIMEAEVKCSASVGHVAHMGLELNIAGGAGENHQGLYHNSVSAQDSTSMEFEGVIRTLPIVIPVGATGFVPQLEMATSIGGTCQFDWGRVRCWKVS